MGVLRRFFPYLRPHLGAFLGGFVCMTVVTLANLLLPLIFGRELVDRILIARQSPALLNLVAGGIILLFIVKGLFAYGQRYLLSYVGNRVVADLREKIYRHLQRLSLHFHEEARTGELISRTTNDTAMLQTFISVGIVDFIQNALTLLGILGFIFYLHARLASVLLISLPLGALAIHLYGERIRQIARYLQEKTADLTAVLAETIGDAMRVVKAFTLEGLALARFRKENERSFQASMHSSRLTASLTPVVELIVALSMTAVIWYGGHEVLAGRLTTGSLFSFLAYAGMAMTPVAALSGTFSLGQQALAALERIWGLLDTEDDVPEAPGAIMLPPLRGEIRFEGVSFHYPGGEPVLVGINLRVAPGEVVALVGPSGAGKTTLASLLLRFYDPTAGRILLDGYDLREVKLASLRAQMALVPQETLLFSATVRENIAYGRPGAREEEIIAAARLANAEEFIQNLPQGYDTVLGERGLSLSGGQRQRLAIARALLRNPRILILDEATSALDTETEAVVQAALERLMAGRTTLIIAHRLSTVMRANRIVVLAGGRVVEEGTHSELLAQGGIYARLYAGGEETPRRLNACGDQ